MLDTVAGAFRAAIGLDANFNDISVMQMAARGLVIYLAGLALVRMAKKRFLGRQTAFDGVLAVMLGSCLSRAINGTNAFWQSIAASLVLVGAHWAIGLAAFHSHRLGDVVKGSESELVHDGRIDRDAMRAHHISGHDLSEAMRLHGRTTELAEVATARLERSGDISVIKRRRQPRILEVAVAPGVQTIRIEID